mgnify:CR=1 FL=1
MIGRIKALIAFLGLSTRAFAIKCGLRQNTLSNQLNGMRELSLSTVAAILEAYPEVSAEWLMRGNGQMLIQKENNSAEMERVNRLVDTITTLQDAINSKNDAIATLSNRVMQLETQLNK